MVNNKPDQSKKSVWSKPLPPLHIIIVLLSVFLLISLVFNIKFYSRLAVRASAQLTPTATPTPALSPLTCKAHTYPIPTPVRSAVYDKFFNTYTVVAGDTLLSVAKKQMGDVSRVNELINLNKGQYPSLSLQSPFLEVGMKLYTTPNYFPPNSGNLYIVEGIIIQTEPEHWFVEPSAAYPDAGSVSIDIRSSTKFMGGKKMYKVGDCISVIMDYRGIDEHNALVIWPQ